MQTKYFHLGDVLSITTGRLLSPRGMKGVYEILNFMTGDDLFTHQLPRASKFCKPELLKQHPQLDSPEMTFAVGELILMLESDSGKKNPEQLITGWLLKLAATYGEELAITSINDPHYQSIDPVEEASEIIGKNRVIPLHI